MRKIVVLLVAVALLSIAFTGCCCITQEAAVQESPTHTEEPQNDATDPTIVTPEVEYLVCSVSELIDALEENALNAKDFYADKNVEITGRVDVIDASGSYISLYPTNDEWSFMSVQCYIKNDEQLDVVKTISKGDIVTLRGEITMVGEVLGYSLDIHSFVEK